MTMREKIYLSKDSNKYIIRMPFKHDAYPFDYVITWNYVEWHVKKSNNKWYIVDGPLLTYCRVFDPARHEGNNGT